MDGLGRLAMAVAVVPTLFFSSVCLGDQATDDVVKRLIEGAATDAERASRLYEAAKIAEGNERLQVPLLEKAVDYALKSLWIPASRTIAEGSLDLLARTSPEKKDSWVSQRTELYRRWYRLDLSQHDRQNVGNKLIALLLEVATLAEKSNNWTVAAASYREAYAAASALKLPTSKDILLWYRRAQHFANVQYRVAEYLRSLHEDPKNVPVRESLLRTLVADLDDPWEAQKYLTDDVDPTWRSYIPLVTQPVAKIGKDRCKELGDWYYKEVARDAHDFAKPRLLSRAKAYYGRFLELHTNTDAQYVLVELAVRQLEKELGSPEAPSVDIPIPSPRIPPDMPEIQGGTLGAAKGHPFHESYGPDVILIGLLVGFDPGGIHILRPLFRDQKQQFEGATKGHLPTGGAAVNATAPEGFAVGAIEGIGDTSLHSLRLVFYRITPTGLDPSKQQESKWCGMTPQAGAGSKRVDMRGRQVIGICGTWEPTVGVTSLGLVTWEETKPSPTPFNPGGYKEVDLIGGLGGNPFSQPIEKDCPLVGLSVAYSNECLTRVQPVYLATDGRLIYRRAAPYNGPSSRMVIAPRGYVIAGIIGTGGNTCRGIRVVFMKSEGQRLNTTAVHLSDWIGSEKEFPNQVRLGCDGTPIVGIQGRVGSNLDSLGVIKGK